MLYGRNRSLDGYDTVITVLILIFLENALRRVNNGAQVTNQVSLNPYFFGKCSTASSGKTIATIENLS